MLRPSFARLFGQRLLWCWFGLLLVPIIRVANPQDADTIRAMLVSARLPVDDIPTSPVEFLIAEDDAGVSGVIGIEPFQSVALLRSLAVAPEQRGAGLGRALVETLESHARASGVSQLVLLTETAAPFFHRLGYVQSARDAAPSAIQSTAEFRSLCPVSATCMTKALP